MASLYELSKEYYEAIKSLDPEFFTEEVYRSCIEMGLVEESVSYEDWMVEQYDKTEKEVEKSFKGEYDKIKNVLMFAQNIRSEAEAFDVEIKRLKEKQEKKAKLYERLNNYVDMALRINHKKDIDEGKFEMDLGIFTIKYGKSEVVASMDESLIPESLKEFVCSLKGMTKEQYIALKNYVEGEEKEGEGFNSEFEIKCNKTKAKSRFKKLPKEEKKRLDGAVVIETKRKMNVK